MQINENKIDYGFTDLDDAFPACDPGVQPFGSRVLVQIRTPKRKSKGGIIITDEARETDHYNTQVGKVIAVGELAFKNRNTQEPWPEGSWCVPGDYIRAPKYGGDRWSVTTQIDGEKTEIVFVILNDLDLIGKITGDPLQMKAYL